MTTPEEKAQQQHESNMARADWATDADKLWCLHRALQLNSPTESQALLGDRETFWSEEETKKLKELYYKKLLAL